MGTKCRIAKCTGLTGAEALEISGVHKQHAWQSYIHCSMCGVKHVPLPFKLVLFKSLASDRSLLAF
jgi:hypothetical protein